MHPCHANMQPYLADLEQRVGLPITYQRWSSRYAEFAPFKKEIEIFGPTTGTPSPFDLPYKDDVCKVDVTHCTPPTGEPIVLMHGDNQYTVASLKGRRVTLAFDLERIFENPGDIQPGLILEAVLAVACQKAAQHVTAYDWKDEAARFVAWNVQGTDAQVAGWRVNIRDNEHELERLFAMVASLTRKNAELRELIGTTSASTKKDREVRAAAEFRDITKMFPAPVETFDVEHGQLVVRLRPITLEDDGSEYEMGRFTLQISNESVRIYSDSGHRYPHPHVSSDGIPCWGNLGPSIARLLGERQYAGLIVAVVEFLHSYNERDAYRRIEHWDPDHEDDE